MARKFTIDDLQEKARVATRKALLNYIFPEYMKEELVLGVMIEDDYYIYELYVAGERPERCYSTHEGICKPKDR